MLADNSFYSDFRTFCIALDQVGITSEKFDIFHAFKWSMNIFTSQITENDKISAIKTLVDLSLKFNKLKKVIAESGNLNEKSKKLFKEYTVKFIQLLDQYSVEHPKEKIKIRNNKK